MRTLKVIGLAFLGTALLGLAGVLLASAGDPPTELYVRTEPPGAKVSVNGKELGASPGLFKVDPGVAKIVVSLEGHEPKRQQVEIRPSRITRVEVALGKRPLAGTPGTGDSVGGTALASPPPKSAPRRVFSASHGANRGILSVAFSWDAKAVAAVDEQAKVTLYDVHSARPPLGFDVLTPEEKNVLLYENRKGRVHTAAVAFSPDGKTLAVAADPVVRLYDARTGRLQRALEDKGLIEELKKLGGKVSDELKTLAAVPHAQGRVFSLAFSPDGTLLATSGLHLIRANGASVISAKVATHGKLKLWDAKTGELKRDLGAHYSEVRGVAFSRDGQTLACIGSYPPGWTTGVRCWDPQRGAVKSTFSFAQAGLEEESLALSPDGTLVAASAMFREVDPSDPARTHRPRTFRLLVGSALTGHILLSRAAPSLITSASFSADGKILATGMSHQGVSLWDPQTLEPKGGIQLSTDPPGNVQVAFSPTGNLLAVGATNATQGGFVTVWEIGPGQDSLAKASLSPQSVLPRPEPRKDETVSFGPIVEQLLKSPEPSPTDPDRQTAELLDLETGKRARMEEYFGSHDGQTHRWVREHGMHVLGIREQADARILLFDVAVYENPGIRWDAITADEVDQNRELEQTEPKTVVALAAKGPSELPKTCLFRTREGSLGVLQLVGAEGSDLVKIRYRLVERITEEQAARLASGSSFARAVADDKSGQDWFYDLDTGQFHTPPWKLIADRKPEEMLAWIRGSGVDLTGVKPSSGLVEACDLRVGRIKDATWDRLTPAQVREAVRRLQHGPRRSEPSVQFGAKGLVHAFQTREGGIGVLTVIDNPKGKGLLVLYRVAGRSGTESGTEWSNPSGSAAGPSSAGPAPPKAPPAVPPAQVRSTLQQTLLRKGVLRPEQIADLDKVLPHDREIAAKYDLPADELAKAPSHVLARHFCLSPMRVWFNMYDDRNLGITRAVRASDTLATLLGRQDAVAGILRMCEEMPIEPQGQAEPRPARVSLALMSADQLLLYPPAFDMVGGHEARILEHLRDRYRRMNKVNDTMGRNAPYGAVLNTTAELTRRLEARMGRGTGAGTKPDVQKAASSPQATSAEAPPPAALPARSQVDQALDLIEHNYVAGADRGELTEAAIRAMIGKLDQGSNYFSHVELMRLREQLDERLAGVGLSLKYDPNARRLVVMTPLPKMPAYEASVRAGDAIVEIDGKPISGFPQGKELETALKLVRGKPGDPVVLGVKRAGSDAVQQIRVVRAMMHLTTVAGDVRKPDGSWDLMLDERQKIGYVRLSYFAPQSTQEVQAALGELRSRGMKGLILDLRENPGGSLSEGIQVADLFVESGIIVSVKGRDDPGRVWFAKKEGTWTGFPMAVLVNGGSAGASEIVAACLQDHKRAIVVGDRTFGKGTAHGVFPLEGGDQALKLTTAYFLRPNGKSLHRLPGAKESDDWGVVPDAGFESKPSPVERQQYVEYRQQRDVFRKEGPPKSDFRDRPLLKAFDYLLSVSPKS